MEELGFQGKLAHGQQAAVLSGNGFRERLSDVHLLIELLTEWDVRCISCLPFRHPQGNNHTFVSFVFYFGLYFLNKI